MAPRAPDRLVRARRRVVGSPTTQPAGPRPPPTRTGGRRGTPTARREGRDPTNPSGTVATDPYNAKTGRLQRDGAQCGTALTKSYSYVPAGQPGAGHVHTISDGTTTMTFGYDADAHVISRGYSDGTTTSAHYTDTGLLATTTDVTGAVTTYHYDTAGRITSATQTRGTTVLASETYSYDAMSRVATITRGNGVTTTNTWTATQPAQHPTHHHRFGDIGRGARLHLRHPRQPRHSHRHRPGRSTTPSSAGHLDHRLPLRRLQPAAQLSHLLRPQHRRAAATATSYTINTAGDVTGTTTTTRPQNGAQQQPPAKTQKPKKR